MATEDVNALAPEGQVYVCTACGKVSRTVSGFDDDNNHVADWGWDVSCTMRATLCYESSIERGDDKRVNHAVAVKEQPDGSNT